MKNLPEINCDLGEGIPGETALIPLIDTASVACGGHIGDEKSVFHTLVQLKEFGKKAGAHPSYPDKENFGRISVKLSKEELLESVLSQIHLVERMAAKVGIPMDHIKFHGALYNDAAAASSLADLLTACLVNVYPNIPLFVPPHSFLAQAAVQKGMEVKIEVFGDRGYQDNFQLLPRSHPGSLLTSPTDVKNHLGTIFTDGFIRSVSGKQLKVSPDTVCFHGDNPGISAFLPEVHQLFWK